VSIDLTEFPVALDVAAWYDDVSGSMAARGVADMTSRISRDEDDEVACGGKIEAPVLRYSGRWLVEFTELSQWR
jgi:hypothetical protein